MSASTTPVFVKAPRCASKLVSAANTNRDGTGTIVDIWTAGSDGSRIEHVDIIARGTTTAGIIRLYIYDGTTYFLFREYSVTAATPSGTVKCFAFTENFSLGANVLVLPTGYKLGASTHNAENFNVSAHGGDF